jgi:hypothetical protein
VSGGWLGGGIIPLLALVLVMDVWKLFICNAIPVVISILTLSIILLLLLLLLLLVVVVVIVVTPATAVVG